MRQIEDTIGIVGGRLESTTHSISSSSGPFLSSLFSSLSGLRRSSYLCTCREGGGGSCSLRPRGTTT